MIIEFLIGFIIPFVARKVIKIFPEESGTTLAYVLTYRKTKAYPNSVHRTKWFSLFLRLLTLAVFYGLLFVITVGFLENQITGSLFWMGSFVWILLVLLEIDRRVLLLPDVLTVPFIILGFFYACLGFNITPLESAVGAMFGYFMPTIASCLVCFFKKDSIGGGDIKILAGLGAWLGMYYLGIAIVISFFIFLVFAVLNKSKTGPYGPAIVIASIIAMILKTNTFFNELLLWG